ncbi:hypothetical protein H5410_028071, partial [Solanum commersonii]
ALNLDAVASSLIVISFSLPWGGVLLPALLGRLAKWIDESPNLFGELTWARRKDLLQIIGSWRWKGPFGESPTTFYEQRFVCRKL